jgi:hypothetical protein
MLLFTFLVLPSIGTYAHYVKTCCSIVTKTGVAWGGIGEGVSQGKEGKVKLLGMTKLG